MSRESKVQSREQETSVTGTAATPPDLCPSTLVRYGSIYAALWKNSVTRETMFKGNFLLWIVVELCWFALQLAFIGVLYLHTDAIGSWTKWQVVLLVGASQFIQQVYQAFFLIEQWEVIELQEATLDELATSSSCWLNLYRGAGKPISGVVRFSDGEREVDVPFYFAGYLNGDCGKGITKREANACWIQIDLIHALAGLPTGATDFQR